MTARFLVAEEGQVFTGSASTSKPLNLQRVPGIQNARAVFTDFKANNFAYIQNVYGCVWGQVWFLSDR